MQKIVRVTSTDGGDSGTAAYDGREIRWAGGELGDALASIAVARFKNDTAKNPSLSEASYTIGVLS